MKWKFEKLMVPVVVLVIGLTAQAVNANLIALWDFDYGGAHDSCGESHGQLNGYLDWVTGHRGKGLALSLEGSGFVSVDNESTFDIAGEIAVAAWIKVHTFDRQWQAIVTKGDSAWRLARESDENTLSFHCTGVTSNNNGRHSNFGVEGNMNVNDGQWHHVVGVYDGSKIYLYVDGALDRSLDASGTIDTSNHQVCIGENAERQGRNFKGLIDEVAIFDQALNDDEVRQLYDQGAASFIPKSHMIKLVGEIQVKVKELPPQEAVTFLEKRIDEYEQWKLKNLNNIEPCDRQLSPDILYLLAKAKEAAGLPKQDVVTAYKQSILRVTCRTNYVPAALLWLFEKVPPDDYVNVVNEFVRNCSVLPHTLYHVAKHLESTESWNAFKLFLDGVFSAVGFRGQTTYSYARIIAKGLKEDGAWAAKFRDYCRKKPGLTEYVFHKHEQIARTHKAQQNFAEAAEVYRDIISQCGPNQKKAIYEFKLCECLYNDGQYDSAVQELNSFIKNNRASHRILASQALMLKGQAYVHLGQIDRATDTFFDLLIEYPESKLVAEANFFVGYCYMLQSRFDEATEAFNLVVQDYPESEFANKARSYVSRIKNMTE
jgi:tetratricopeptide (TPR) repeat protein